MARCISINDAIKIAVKALGSDTYKALDVAIALEDAPAADVIEIVRCKDCIYNHNGSCIFSKENTSEYDPEYYCAGADMIENENLNESK